MHREKELVGNWSTCKTRYRWPGLSNTYGFCGEYGCMISIISCGMVWYVSKHKHKEDLGTLDSVVERLEALWNCACVSSASEACGIV